MTVETQVVEVGDGRRASYAVVGEGEPLLWLEGGPGYPAQLGLPDCELVGHRFRCYLVDSPGLGQSTPPEDARGYEYEQVVEFFDEVRKALGIERWTLMGHSWGGFIALAYAIAVPDAVARVIVIDGYAGDASVPLDVAEAESERVSARHADQNWFAAAIAPGVKVAEETTTSQFTADMWPRYPLYFAHPDRPAQRDHIARLRREAVVDAGFSRSWDGTDYAAGIDLTGRLGEIACPVLVLVGRHDWVCGPVWADVIAEHVPHVRKHVFEESGHIPQYEEPEEFVALLEAWLADCP